MNQKQRAEYQKYLERLASEKDMINTALDDGKELGRIEAEQKLIPLIEQERQKVELERQKLIETVKNLKSLGVSIDIIVKSTGLSIDEIEKL
jgi:predicted transposase/invertase (TIGR01784 family)